MISFQVKIALDRKIFSAGSLFGFRARGNNFDERKLTIDDFKQQYKNLLEGRIPEVISVYAPVPSNFDPSLAPAGGQLITACTAAPTTDIKLQDPEEVWFDELINALEELIPGLKRHMIWCDRFDTRFVENWIGKEFGPAISTAQTTDQVGKLRPSIQTPIRGLYFAGDGAGGRGVGTELATQSGIECSDIVTKDHNSGLSVDSKEI